MCDQPQHATTNPAKLFLHRRPQPQLSGSVTVVPRLCPNPAPEPCPKACPKPQPYAKTCLGPYHKACPQHPREARRTACRQTLVPNLGQVPVPNPVPGPIPRPILDPLPTCPKPVPSTTPLSVPNPTQTLSRTFCQTPAKPFLQHGPRTISAVPKLLSHTAAQNPACLKICLKPLRDAYPQPPEPVTVASEAQHQSLPKNPVPNPGPKIPQPHPKPHPKPCPKDQTPQPTVGTKPCPKVMVQVVRHAKSKAVCNCNSAPESYTGTLVYGSYGNGAQHMPIGGDRTTPKEVITPALTRGDDPPLQP